MNTTLTRSSDLVAFFLKRLKTQFVDPAESFQKILFQGSVVDERILIIYESVHKVQIILS